MSIRVVPVEKLMKPELQAWSELQRADTRLHNPFFRPEFALLVGQVNPNIEVAVFENNGKPIGFFPFEREAGMVGRPIGGHLSDMHGIIGETGPHQDIAAILRACGLLTWTFDHLLASQSLFEPYHECMEPSLYMDLSKGFKAYCEERKQAGCSSIQKAERRKRQLAREVGPLRWEWHNDDPEIVATLCRWKQEQLRQMNYQDMFHQPYYHELLNRIGSQRKEAFSGVVSALYAGDHLVAAQFGVQSYEVLSVTIPAFNSQFSKYSPGVILHLELARHCNDWGATHIELGRGENQLKTSFRSGSVPLALGAVDLRPVRALMRKAWFRTRTAVYASPLRTVFLHWYRRVRNRVVRQPIPVAKTNKEILLPDFENESTEVAVEAGAN